MELVLIIVGAIIGLGSFLVGYNLAKRNTQPASPPEYKEPEELGSQKVSWDPGNLLDPVTPQEQWDFLAQETSKKRGED